MLDEGRPTEPGGRGRGTAQGHAPFDALAHSEHPINGFSPDADQLFNESYTHLRSLAGRYFKNERSDHTLQPTALVHEAYIRLTEHGNHVDRDRLYFLAAAGRSMRQILVRHAERRAALKRHGGRKRLSIETLELIDNRVTVDVLELDEAISRLANDDPRCARVVELRFFAGLTIDETAAVLAISPRTVAFDWRFARAWLMSELS